MHKLEEKMYSHVKAISAYVDNYWKKHDECEPAKPSLDVVQLIESLVSEYGYHKVANAFNIDIKQYYFTFNEYTTDAESFELNEDVLGDKNDEFYTYKAYCRWRPYWPLLISEKHMNVIKEYENRVRKCHGEFFMLTKQVLRLPVAIFNRLGEWGKNIFDWNEDEFLIDTFEFRMTDAELEMNHARFQCNSIKKIVLELINTCHELPFDAIIAYTLCKTRSVTPDGWGPDVYVLSKSDRDEIIQTLSAKVGAEVVANLLDKASKNESYHLSGTDERENAFGICFDKELYTKNIYRPKVDVEKYLLPLLPIDND